MVRTLSNFVDERVLKAKKPVIPASRSYGISALPNELVVRIMNLVGGQFYDDPRKLREFIWGFFDIPIFDACIKDVKLLLNRSKPHSGMDFLIVGGIPTRFLNPYAEEFFFDDSDSYSFNKVIGTLGLLSELQRLDLGANFRLSDLNKNWQAETVNLDQLRWLRIRNDYLRETHSITGSDDALESLAMIVSGLRMPQLEHVVLDLDVSRVPSVKYVHVVDNLLRPNLHTYENVHTFEVKRITESPKIRSREINLSKILMKTPALSSLILGSSDYVDYCIDIKPECLSKLHSVRFEFEDFGVRSEGGIAWTAGSQKAAFFCKRAKAKASLKKVIVKTSIEANFNAITRYVEDAEQVTSKSILEDWDDSR